MEQYQYVSTPKRVAVSNRNRRSGENNDDFGAILKKKVESVANSIDLNNEEQIANIICDALLEVNDKNLPPLNSITEVIIPTFTDSDESKPKLIDLCSYFIGEDRRYYKETLLYNAAIKRKQAELVQKLFNCGFNDNNKHSKLIKFIFTQAAQQFTSTEENKNIIRIILDYKKSIEPEYISSAIKSNNIELLNIYFDYYRKCTKKSIEPKDISDAIKSSNIELLEFFFKFDKSLKTKIISRNNLEQKSYFDLAVESSDIRTIKYLLNKLKQNQTKDILDAKIKNIANERRQKSPDQGVKIDDFLAKKLKIIENQECYLKALFELDADTITQIYEVLQELLDMYQNNRFLLDDTIIEHNQTNSLLECVQNSIKKSYNEKSTYTVVNKLKKIAVLIDLLCTHDGGIQNKFDMMPWSELKLLPEALVNVHRIDKISKLDARKLLEKISYDIYKLLAAFKDLIASLQKEGKISFEKFNERKEKNSIQVSIDNINDLTKKLSDEQVVSATLQEINILKSLDFSNVNDRYAFVQCLQSVGEKYKHFSPDAQEFLRNFDVTRKMRDKIAHIWNRNQYTAKFLTMLAMKKQQDTIMQFFDGWKVFIVDKYEQILQKIQKQYDQLNFSMPEALDSTVLDRIKPNKLEDLVRNIPVSNEMNNVMPSTDSVVDSKMNLIKYLVNNIQKIVEDTIRDNDYQQIRSAVAASQTHYKFIFILTIIGESIHTIKNEDDYLSVADFELLKELDFLKYIRNALMHLSDINENGTLIDYLSNDLLAEFSIATHGQKIIEFNEYFKYLSGLIDRFQQNLSRLGDDNFLQNYQDEHERYLDFDVEYQKHIAQKTINSFSTHEKKRQYLDTNEFNIHMLLHKQIEIESKCKEFNINVEGVFGKLATMGYTGSKDLSGLLITMNGDLSLDNIAKFKQFVFEKLKYRLKIVEIRQLVEYVEYTINDKQRVNDYTARLVETTKKYSLENLKNNMKLIHALEDEEGDVNLLAEDYNISQGMIEQFSAKLELENIDKISFDLSYVLREYENHREFSQPVIHQLYSIYREEDNEKIQGNILRLVQEIFNKGADINIADLGNGQTILHQLCDQYDEAFFTLIKEYKDLNVNLCDRDNRLPIEIALEKENLQLINFLKDKTSYKESLLISAVRVGNIEYIKHLITNTKQININITGEDGTPIIHYAIFDRYYDYSSYDYDEIKCKQINADNGEKYHQVIKLLLENGAEVYSFKEQHPLVWSLKNNDVELSLLLVKNTVDLHYYFPQDGICPIHQAVLNINQFPAQSDNYIKLIQEIAEKSKGNLDFELHHGQETPLYLTAKQKDLAVDLRLKIMKILIDNGAYIHYKIHRFYQIKGINNEEIIKFFVDNGMRGACLFLSHYSDLFLFYKEGKVQQIKELIAAHSLNINALDSEGKNLFYYAIEKQDEDFIDWLSSQASVSLDLNTKFDQDTFDSYYEHLSYYANGPILKVLQEKGIINWKKFNYSNILNICDNAFKHDDLELIKLLEEHKYFHVQTARPVTVKIEKYLKLYFEVFERIKRNENEELDGEIKKLKNKSVLFDSGYSLLHTAVSAKNLHIVEFLLDHADVLDKNILSGAPELSALDLAITLKSPLEIIKVLIKQNVKISKSFPIHEYLILSDQDVQNEEKYNLILEYIKQNPDYKEIILKQAYKPGNIHFLEEEYQLQRLRNPSFIKLLLELGWNPNEYGGRGYNVLHKCAYHGYNDSIKVLHKSEKLDFELPITNLIIWSTSGILTAVGFALENKNFDTAKLLIQLGASPYKYLSILLLDAAYKQDTDYIKLLLQKSIIYDDEETRAYLDHWLKKSFTRSKIQQAVDFLSKNKNIDIPDYILTNLCSRY